MVLGFPPEHPGRCSLKPGAGAPSLNGSVVEAAEGRLPAYHCDGERTG